MDDPKITNRQRDLLVKFVANERRLPVYAGGKIDVDAPMDDESLMLMAKDVVAFYAYKLAQTKTTLHDILFPETQ